MDDPISFALDDNGPEPLQDENTSEAIVFGPAYSWIKNVMWIWDEIEDYLRNKADSLEGQISDREWAYHVMMHNPYLINARSPPVNEPNRINDLFILRSLVKCLAAIEKIGGYRKQNVAWARMKGVERYVRGMEGRGITEAEWGSANSMLSMDPVTYDNVHGLSDFEIPEEDVDLERVMEDILGPEEYKALRDEILGKDEGAEEQYDEPEVRDTMDFSFVSELKELFSDPVADAMQYLMETNDECSVAAGYWTETMMDGRDLIDILIQFAEGME